MPRVFGQKKANLFIFPKLLFSLLTHMHVRWCLTCSKEPSVWAELLRDAMLSCPDWPSGVAVLLLGLLGSLRAHWHSLPKVEHTAGILMGSPPLLHCQALQCTILTGLGCFWDIANEPIFVTVVLQDNWNVTSQAVPARGCSNADQATVCRDPREDLCSSITQTHLKDLEIKSNTSFSLTKSTPGLLLSRETNQAFLYGNTLLFCLLKTLKSHTLISYSMQACEPLHLDVEGKIYPWHKNQSH